MICSRFKSILSAFLLFLAGLSYGQSGNLQYFIVGTDTVLYNLDDVYEVFDNGDQVVMKFFKPTISVTAEMTFSQFMARSCSQFVRVTLPNGQERAFSKRFITHIKKNNNGKGAIYMMEMNRTQLTDETVSYIIDNYTVCGGIDVGDGGGATVDSFYYSGGVLTIETSDGDWDITLTDEQIEIGSTLNVCGTSYFAGTTLKDVLEAIDACMTSYEANVHPPVTLDAGTNPGLILDTTNQVLSLDLDAANSYSNLVSGLTAITIQDAIDELAERGDALNGPFLVFELDTTLTNESQLVPDSTIYLTTNGDTTTIGVLAGGIHIVHLDSLLRDSIFNVSGDFWDLNGNTVGGYGKFLGTIDSQKLVLKTNNIQRLWLSEVEDRFYLGDSLFYGTMVFDTLEGEGFVIQTYSDVLSPASEPIRFRIKTDGSKTVFYEPLAIHEEWVTLGLGIMDNDGSVGTAGQVATSDGYGWTWEDIDALPAAQRTETLWFDGSEWVADSTIANSGDSVVINANSNMPFRVHNGTVNVLKLTNAGEVFLSDATKATSLFPVLTTTATPSASTGLGMMFYSRGTTETNYPTLALTGLPAFNTSGTVYSLHNSRNFTPTSGTGAFNWMYLGGTINQTGGSTGVTRGINIAHVLTSAPNYAAIEIGTLAGRGMFQTSATPTNHFRGNTIIGDTIAPTRTLHVAGTARITGDVGGADAILGVQTADGDVARLKIGSGLFTSGDTLYSSAFGPGGLNGMGTVNYVAKWTPDSISLGDSQIFDSLNVGINTNTPSAQLDIVGDDELSTTRSLVVSDSSRTRLFSVTNDGRSHFGGNASAPRIFPITGTAITSASVGGLGLGFYNQSVNQVAYGFSAANTASTSGTATTFQIDRGLTAASGSMVYHHMLLTPLINQTGGANGASYGLRVVPTLTSAYDFKAISVEGTTGVGYHQSGAAAFNLYEGNTHFGALTSAIRQFQVTGDARISADVDTATVTRLWAGNTAGDLRKIKPYGNLVISNDTITSPHYSWSLEDATSGPAPFYSGDILQVLGTGTVTATLDTATRILTIDGAGPAGSGGETNLGLNVGPGEEIYKGKTDTTLLFRTLVDDGLTVVTQVGDSIVINTPAQTLSTSNDSIYISGGNGVKVPGTIANGTTYNSTLRWNNVIWKQNALMLADSLGHTGIGTALQTTKSITTAKDISVFGVNVGRGGGDDILNVSVGADALFANTGTGENNTAVGAEAMYFNETGDYNTAVGRRSNFSQTAHAGTFVGHHSGNSNNASQNTGIGAYAFGSAGTKTGTNNLAAGYQTLQYNTSASFNTALGAYALSSSTTSGSNTGIGFEALYTMAGAGVTFNAALGSYAGRDASTTATTFLGSQAGYFSTSDYSIFAGYRGGYTVTKDSVLFFDVGSDTTGAIVGDLNTNSIGINRNPWGIARTLDVGGTARVRSSVDTATVNALWGSNTIGDLRKVKLGNNLSFSNDTLNASGGGGGMPFDTTVTPTKLVGVNATHDTLTDIHGDFHDYGAVDVGGYQLKNARIQADTLMTLRGSYAQVYEQTAWSKTIAGSTIDTLDIDNTQGLFDFASSNGTLTHSFGPEEVVLPGYSGIEHLMQVNASISVRSSSQAEATLAIYQTGTLLNYCYAEFELDVADEKEVINISCIVNMGDGDTIDLRLGNVETTPRTFTIERANINIHHFKSRMVPGF